jgi:hypothetical protein
MGKGVTAEKAFAACIEHAQYECGHGGYTGTIAEKHDFVMISVPVGKDPVEFANELLESGDRRVIDKWGPAGCVCVKEGVYYFFGWASC